MNHEWRRTLLPWARLYMIGYRMLARHMSRMSENDLRGLLAATEWPTTTNCTFDVYRVAQLLHLEIVAELHHRTRYSHGGQ